jgi:hypothetical protein
MKTLKTLFIFGWIALLTAGCEATGNLDIPEDEEEDDTNYVPSSGVFLLKEVYLNNQLFEQFSYDGENRLTELMLTNEGGTISYALNYNSSGDVSGMYLYGNWQVNFSRSNDTITIDYGGGVKSKVLLNNKGLPDKVTYFDGCSDTYTYDGAGNVTKRTICDKDKNVTFSCDYTYDAKTSPFYDCATPRWFLICWIDTWVEVLMIEEAEAEDVNDPKKYETADNAAAVVINSIGMMAEMTYKNNIVTQKASDGSQFPYTYIYNTSYYPLTRKMGELTFSYKYY